MIQRNAAEAVTSSTSAAMFERAKKSVAGGADSSMRVVPYCLPLFVDRADGPYVWDVEGNRFIDLNMGYGPQLLGHRAPPIMDAMRAELSRRGSAVGFPHQLSHEAAELISAHMPSIELLRFTSTG